MVRPGAQYSASDPVLPLRRFSNTVIAGFSVLALLVVGGGVVAGIQVADSMKGVSSPLVSPSLRPKEAPAPLPAPRPTVTVTAKTVPDAERVKQNKLYRVGRLASAGCQEPAVKPTSKQAVLKYYQRMLPCLNKFWAPVVRKAGYPFRAPKLVVYDNGKPNSPCSGHADTAFYCGGNETISMRWQDDVKSYKRDPLWARVDMMSTMAHEYGHHVQMLTNILISSTSREGWAKTKAAKLEENRRMELQASCLGALFLGANKASMELTGRKLAEWEYLAKHSGDEYNPKKVRDHGSKASHWYWESGAFRTPDPAKCNTFTAPAKRVS
ncbi:neutral zinc metallopeptidase [Kribbella deserti]|uniref:Neutral zinc metallopeptidase n=1 Tax=Kribbella deserti TaxID=1926257 RepID=A0ABV6QGD8_9ACTN